MALTETNVRELNNMNEAARRAELGTLLQGLEGGGAAAASVAPTLPVMAAQADSKATDVEGLVKDFNSLLAKLRKAGLMA